MGRSACLGRLPTVPDAARAHDAPGTGPEPGEELAPPEIKSLRRPPDADRLLWSTPLGGRSSALRSFAVRGHRSTGTLVRETQASSSPPRSPRRAALAPA